MNEQPIISNIDIDALYCLKKEIDETIKEIEPQNDNSLILKKHKLKIQSALIDKLLRRPIESIIINVKAQKHNIIVLNNIIKENEALN